MSNKFTAQKVVEVKEIELEILEIESDAFIVNVNGWRMRVFFEKGHKHSSLKKVLVKYTGDLKDVHSVKFEKLK
jgi:hypothetical protein